MLRYLKTAVLVTGLLAVPAFSSILTQKGPLTLEQCIALALESNLRIEIANEKISEQSLAVKEASTSQLPKLSAQASYTRFNESKKGIAVGPDVSSIDFPTGTFERVEVSKYDLGANAYRAEVSLTQPIYTGGRISIAKQISQYSLNASEWQRKGTIREIKRDVTKAYYNVLAARKSLVALDSAIALMEVVTKDLSNAVDVGMRGEHELLQAQVQLLNQRLSRQQASSGADAAAAYLSTLIGYPISSPLDLVIDLESPEGLDMPDLPTLQTRAREASADLKALEEQLSIVEASAKIAGATYLPNVIARAAYNGEGLSFDKNSQGKWTNGGNISLVAQWDFYDGGAARHKERQAKSQMRQVELGKENLKIMLDMLVKNNRTAIEDAFLSIETSRKNIEQSKRSYEISYDKFQEGVLLSSELLNAQNMTLQAEIGYYAALSNFYAAMAELDYLVNPDN